MIRLCLLMFLQFFIWGSWYVTVGLFMGEHLPESSQGAWIGWAYSVGPIAAIVSPFFLGLVADRYFPTQHVLGALHLLGGLALLAAAQVQLGAPGQGTVFILLLLLHMLCYMPTLGLANSLAFHHLPDRERLFPWVRVFGTIGWIVAGWLIGLWKADRTALPLQMAGASALILGLFSFVLPHTPPPGRGRAVSWRTLLGLDALVLLRDPSFAVFLIASLLICIPLAAYYAFAPTFLGSSGIESPAAVMLWGQISEVGFMVIMPLFFARLGVKGMLLVGMLAWVLRYALFALGAPQSVVWMLFGGVLLHGICYDFFFVTGQIYVDQRAPRESRAQAQGLLVLITQGIGMLLGAQLAGGLKDAWVPANTAAQWQHFWWAPAAAAGLVTVGFALFFKNPDRARPV